MANIQCAGTGNNIRLKKKSRDRATKALGWRQFNSMQYNIVSHGVIGMKHKIRPNKSPHRAMANIQCACTVKLKKRVLTRPWPTLVQPL